MESDLKGRVTVAVSRPMAKKANRLLADGYRVVGFVMDKGDGGKAMVNKYGRVLWCDVEELI